MVKIVAVFFLVFMQSEFAASADIPGIPKNWLANLASHMRFHTFSVYKGPVGIDDSTMTKEEHHQIMQQKFLSTARHYIALGADCNELFEGKTLLEWANLCYCKTLSDYLLSIGASLPLVVPYNVAPRYSREIETERNIRFLLQEAFMRDIPQLYMQNFSMCQDIAHLIAEYAQPHTDQELMVVMAQERIEVEKELLDTHIVD